MPEMLESQDPKDSLEGEINIEKAFVRPPFIVEDKEDTLKVKLNKIIKWAVKEINNRGRRKKGIIINEAIVKARIILDKDFDKLIDISLRHTNNRIKRRGLKNTVKSLSPEEIKRLEGYKQDYIEDFEKILRDKLKSKSRK